MPNFVPLDNVVHADLAVSVLYNEISGDNINQALVFPTEFNELQREYPIVFRRAGDNKFHAVVLLGLDKSENLFLEEGAWNAKYIPAIRMRGPFTLSIREDEAGNVEDNDPVVQIDMDHPNVVTGKDMPIFLPQGGHSPYLSRIINALQRLHVGKKVEDQFFSELEKYDLIEEITLEAKLSDTEQYIVPDVYTISRTRMATLTRDELHQLNQLGLLEHCFAVMSSTGNMANLVDMKILKN